MKRALAGLAAIATVAVVTACVRPGPSNSAAAETHAGAPAGFENTAETVMGTLVAPRNPAKRKRLDVSLLLARSTLSNMKGSSAFCVTSIVLSDGVPTGPAKISGTGFPKS